MGKIDTKQELICLCDEVMNATISLDEFESRVAQVESQVPKDSFVCDLIEDLRDCVEHCPGFFFKKGVDFETFESSYEYALVSIGRTLLKLDISFEDADKLRFHLLKHQLEGKPLSELLELLYDAIPKR